MISADDANLEKFGRHLPRILGNQIITQLVDQYLSGENSPLIEPDFENTCPPSIERFHGALLFVDISGFTVLSQRLPVDALRLHINAYFKKILDIIFKYGGDVVKFAGDALFIIWQTPVSSLGKLGNIAPMGQPQSNNTTFFSFHSFYHRRPQLHRGS